MSNQAKTYLFQITIPSVQKFINASRKTSDLWAGSFIISYLMKKLLNKIIDDYKQNISIIYPSNSNQPDSQIHEKFNVKETVANVPNVAIFIAKNISKQEADKQKNNIKKELANLLNNIAEYTIEKFFQEEIDDKVKCHKEEYINLAKYQICDTLKLFVEYIELENIENDYKEKLEELAYIINYDKKYLLPDRDCFETFALVNNQNWKNLENWSKFYESDLKQDIIKKQNNKENIKNLELIHGVYRCSSCGEHTIIGATLEDWRGNLIWKTLWEANPKYFKRGERVCGVCLAKRYFRDYLKEKENIDEGELGFPSTSEIGATLFKKEILETLKTNLNSNEILIKFYESFKNIPNFEFKKIKGSLIPKLSQDLNMNLPTDKNLLESKQSNIYKFFKIDGEWFLEDTWKNQNDYKTIGADEKKASQILKSLNYIYNYLKDKKRAEKYHKPSEYYAVIMLDGDSIGEKLSLIKSPQEHQKFSQKISELSKSFKDIVENHYGALIYSGGDDVLALIPVENALECACKIQNEFRKILEHEFPEISKESKFSMSGSIIYTYHKLPLSFILDEIRKCEEKAKEEGRNRVYLKYIKSSLSSADVILEWDRIENVYSFIKALNIPNTFIHQLDKVRNSLNNPRDNHQMLGLSYELKENLLKSLLKNKVEKSLLDRYLDVFYKINNDYDFLTIINSLKIFSFVAQREIIYK